MCDNGSTTSMPTKNSNKSSKKPTGDCNEDHTAYSKSRPNDDTLGNAYAEDIRPYIDIIDNMRKYGLEKYIMLPNVAVVGDQSSGKSSIIEVISGIQLPRGSGTVTRCPLELQLKKVCNKPWKAILSYKPKEGNEIMKIIDNADDVEASVNEAQDELCPSSKCVTKELITLRIESPAVNAPDLTLIDLPGIMRLPTDDQPLDICDTIKDLIMSHVQNENTVILCLISGNLDIGVNESVSIARKVDPNGLRTIGVITKPDLADHDHKIDIRKMMDNEIIDLKKGFNLIRCRSSEQLKKKVSLSKFLINEMEFFENDDIYKDIDSNRVGVVNLSRKITEELVNIIKEKLPDLQKEIDRSLEESEKLLGQMPQCLPEADEDKRSYLINIASQLDEKIKLFLCNGQLLDDINYHHVWRTNFDHFRKDMEKQINQALEIDFGLSNLQQNMVKYRSNEVSGFLSYKLFEDLLKKHIQSYRQFADDLISKMGSKIKVNLNRLLVNSISHLPFIENDVKIILNEKMENILVIARERIDFIFRQEALIFTMDDVFDREMEEIRKQNDGRSDRYPSLIRTTLKSKTSGGLLGSSLPTIFDENITFPITPSLTANSQKMFENIRCYLKIAQTRLGDYIPMAVMQCLLIQLHEDLKIKLFKYFSSQDIVQRAQEHQGISRKRKKVTDKIYSLKKGKFELEHKFNLRHGP